MPLKTPLLAILILVIAIELSLNGCNLAQHKATSDTVTKTEKKSSSEDEEMPGDDWTQVGKEARGNRPVEREYDFLKPLRDDKALEIERNLGIKY